VETKSFSNSFPKELGVRIAAGDITGILLDLKRGDKEAEGRLVPLVYLELRRIAAIHLRGEAARHSLQPTALVHEVYLRLIRIKEVDWQSRSHFFAVSATLMRRILVDHARANRAAKRGDGERAISFDEGLFAARERSPEVLDLDDALTRLAYLDQRQAKIVEMRFFGGLSEDEVAEVLGISSRTVKRDWRLAKAWLYKELAA
jgi:RNA polymerase sigma factor (TIGR02999 family)